jgi:fucose permease
MTQAPSDQTDNSTRSRWAQTVVLWVLIFLLGGVGLWFSAADPLFGGPDAMETAMTMFAFFVGLGLIATYAIWRAPVLWRRWMQRMPEEEGTALIAAKVVTGAVFWIVAVLLVIVMVTANWRPVAVGAMAGGLCVIRLVLDISLHHWLGKKP